jgi:hypothetical protein
MTRHQRCPCSEVGVPLAPEVAVRYASIDRGVDALARPAPFLHVGQLPHAMHMSRCIAVPEAILVIADADRYVRT